ncbi:CvpA family protein [Carnobacterium gallinarum]|uniref:CvpA family protein n=1 Tax=Carnobacterium gallinarum TaxID=2749 RepID=UPI00054FD58D|nr:CvpA family protein [Carnobacterium gallinarum]
MLSIGIIIVLAIGFYGGARRGLVLQVVMTVGYLLSYLIARIYYIKLGANLELFVPYPSATENSKFVFFDHAMGLELDKAFYNAVAFMLILFVGWLLTRFIGSMLTKLTFFPVIKQANYLGGGILSFLVVYVGIFLVLYVAAMIPMEVIQGALRQSSLAQMIVKNTPILSNQIYQWWIGTMG